MVATGDDRTVFLVQTAVLLSLVVLYSALWAVSFWRTECRHKAHGDQRRARKTPSRYTYQQNAMGSAIHSGGGSSPQTTYDDHTTSSTYAGGTAGGAGTDGRSSRHGGSGHHRTFPYWLRRIGVALTVVCAVYGIDLTSSLGWLPVGLVTVLPDFGAALCLATVSCWLFFHTKPLYQQLRGTSGRPGEFPVHLRRTLFVLPVAYGITNVTFDILAPATDRKLFTALGELSFAGALIFYLVVYPYVAWTLTYELDQFSKSVKPATVASPQGASAGLAVAAASDVAIAVANPHTTLSSMSPINVAAARTRRVPTNDGGATTPGATGGTATPGGLMGTGPTPSQPRSARTGDGNESTTTPNSPLLGNASPAMGQSELKLPAVAEAAVPAATTTANLAAAAAVAAPALELSIASSPIVGRGTAPGLTRVLSTGNAINTNNSGAAPMPSMTPAAAAGLTLTVSPLNAHRTLLPVGGWTGSSASGTNSPGASPGRAARSPFSPGGAAAAAAAATATSGGASGAKSPTGAAAAAMSPVPRGGAMHIDTSYIAAAIRTIVLFGVAVEVVAAATGALTASSAIDTLSMGWTVAWNTPTDRPPDTFDPEPHLAHYALFFPIVPLMLWFSWGVK